MPLSKSLWRTYVVNIVSIYAEYWIICVMTSISEWHFDSLYYGFYYKNLLCYFILKELKIFYGSIFVL